MKKYLVIVSTSLLLLVGWLLVDKKSLATKGDKIAYELMTISKPIINDQGEVTTSGKYLLTLIPNRDIKIIAITIHDASNQIIKEASKFGEVITAEIKFDNINLKQKKRLLLK